MEYDYKKNLQHLKERYENKIKNIKDDMIYGSYYDGSYYEGLIQGLNIAIHDIEDILDGLEV